MGKIRATGAFTVGFAPDSIPTATPTNCGVWNATTNYKRDMFIAPYVKHEGAYYLRISDGNCVGINPKTDVASQSRYWQHNEIIDLFCARKIQADEIAVDTITIGKMTEGTGMLIGANAYQGKTGVYASKKGKTSFWLNGENGESIFGGNIKTPFVPLLNSDAMSTGGGWLLKEELSIIAPWGEKEMGSPYIIWLPSSLTYNGAHIKIMNTSFPPYSKTSIRYRTLIRSIDGYIRCPKDIVSETDVAFDEIGIIGGMVELIAVPSFDGTIVEWVVVNQDCVIFKK